MAERMAVGVARSSGHPTSLSVAAPSPRLPQYARLGPRAAVLELPLITESEPLAASASAEMIARAVRIVVGGASRPQAASALG